MKTIQPAATLAIKDSAISPNPNALPFAGALVTCPIGMLQQDVLLDEETADAELPFPSGVTTAKFLALCPVTITDLEVTITSGADEVTLSVPKGQPVFLYDIAAAAVRISTEAGGKLTCVVGG